LADGLRDLEGVQARLQLGDLLLVVVQPAAGGEHDRITHLPLNDETIEELADLDGDLRPLLA